MEPEKSATAKPDGEADGYRRRMIRSAQAALDAHKQAFRLEDGMTPATQVWHLILSLLEYCSENDVDFDLELLNVRQYIAETP